MPQPRENPRDDRLVDAALLPDATKAAIRRAFARRRALGDRTDSAVSQDAIDHFESTDISLQVGDIEAVLCIGVGKPSGLFRRRVQNFWIYVGQRGGEHLFPVSRHATREEAADMLIALNTELAKLKP